MLKDNLANQISTTLFIDHESQALSDISEDGLVKLWLCAFAFESLYLFDELLSTINISKVNCILCTLFFNLKGCL